MWYEKRKWYTRMLSAFKIYSGMRMGWDTLDPGQGHLNLDSVPDHDLDQPGPVQPYTPIHFK